MLRYTVLNNGVKMPLIGLGTHLMNSREHQPAFDYALHCGYRLIDTAYAYLNHSLIGEVLQDNIRHGKLKRHDVFITSKIPNIYLLPGDVKDCLDESLEDLKLSYLDLLLIHNPFGLKNVGDKNLQPRDEKGNRLLYDYDLNETWGALEKLLKDKKARAIGLSNFTPTLIDKILPKASIIPANLQLECNAYCQQDKLAKYCADRGISLTAYAPLGKTYQVSAGEEQTMKRTKILLEDDTIIEIATRRRKTPSQVLIRYLLQRNMCVVPRSSNKERLKENLDVFNFELDSGDMLAISSLNEDFKTFRFLWASDHPNYPQNGELF